MKDARFDVAAAGQASAPVVPRGWLIALGVLYIVPWLIAAAIYTWGGRDSESRATSSADSAQTGASPSQAGVKHSWGQLETTPIVISPPLELVPTNWGPIEAPRWRFPMTTRQQLEKFLLAGGVDRGIAGRLLDASRYDPGINGLIVSPDIALVKALDPRVRAALYLQLALSPLNERQKNAYRHFASSAEAWLGSSLVSPATLRLVQPLVYPIGEFQYFADIDLVRSEIRDPEELQRLAKGLLREATMLVRLRVPDMSRLDEVAEYWGRGGRRTDVRPLLESIATGSPGRSIDISHLLPPIARQHLYRYPQITLKDLEKTSLTNCFWTALNFFNPKPDDRLLDFSVVMERLKRDYYIVHDNLQLGDVVVFAGSDGNYFHAAVYLADNLVFGKSGNSSLAPWTIVPIDRIKGYYVENAGDWNIIYYRRKDL